MITATIAYAISSKLEPASAYTYQLRRRGELFTHDKDQVVLSLLDVRSLIEDEFTTIHKDAYLRDLVEAVTHSKRNILPVIDEKQNLHGMVYLNDIRGMLFDMEMVNRIKVKDIQGYCLPGDHDQYDQACKEPLQLSQIVFQVLTGGYGPF